MKKRILAIILVIAVMLTLVPMSVFANPTGVPQITIDSTTSTQDNTTWAWDAATNTLTLKGINMSLSSEAGSYGIYITGNGTNALTTVNVVVTGNNVISGNTGILYSGSSATVNTINFSGTGSLRVSSGQACSMMLYRTTVNFNSGTYNLSNSSYNNDNIFVIDAAQTTCNFNGATVNMQAAPYGSGYFDSYYDGSEECANSNVYINSGSVTINTHGSNIATNKVVINGGTSDFHVGRTDRITISGNGGKTTINGGQVKKTGGLGLEQFQNNALNTLALTTLTISGVATPTAVTSLTTSPDLGYTYGTTDMKTNANGVIYAYLPAGKTSATVVAGDNTYTGAITSNAGTLTLRSSLTNISLTPVPIAYTDRANAGTKVADLSATGTPTSGITYSLDGSGANDSLFQIDGSQLQIKSGATLAAQSYTVKLKVTDGTPINTYTKLITFTANVRPQTYAVSAAYNMKNAKGVVATATFRGSPYGALYEAGDTATVTVTLSGTAMLTGTYTIGLTSTKAGTITAPATVTKTVTAGATPTDEFLFTFTMPANAVDDLEVTNTFVQAKSASPAATAATVAKTAITQATIDFTLDSAIEGTWKVYDAAANGNIVNGVTASTTGTALTLTHASNIPAGTYYVSVTEAGKTESTRLALTVGTYVAPTYAVSANTNAVQKNGVTATATFGATPYVAGATATVTITLSGTATATGTHTIGLTSTQAGTITPPAIVTKAVTAGANPTDTYAFTFTMPANAVDDLVVTNTFVQAQSTAPTVTAATVAKTAATQSKVDFTLDSALTGTWKVYDAQTDGSIVSDITASAIGTTLSLTHASNIPAGTYYVSVTEAGKTESTRLALTVGAYVAPTYAVSANTNAVQKNGVTATATFGATPYVAGATATVTITLSGTATATGTHTIGLTSTQAGTITPPAIVTKTVTAGAVQTDIFAFTFTMPANAVNDLVVTHDFVQAQSTSPTSSAITVAKTAAIQAKVDFTLGSALTGAWKVYDAATGGNIVSGVTTSVIGTTLSLTHASNIPAGTYYVSVTEAGKTESTRLALTVGTYVAPTYAVSANTNAVQKNGVTATATFGATPYVAGATATVTITLSGTATATGTYTIGLTSTQAGTITPPAIVTKTVTAGAVQTDTFAFTFTMPANAVDDLVVTHNFVQAQSTSPTSSAITVAKTAAIQAKVDFTLGSALTGAWKVYDAATGENIVSGVTTSVIGTTLSLTHASNIPAGTYYVSVTEAGKTESTRLALTVGAYVAPTYSVSAATNAVQANGVTATATFGASPYEAGATAAVTITLSGTATATGTHTIGLTSSADTGVITAPTTVTKTVTAGDHPTDTFVFTFTMPAKAVGDLVVTHNFVQAQSTAPTSSVTTVAKTAATQAKVDFTLGSELTGAWKVYDAQTGGSIVSGVTASTSGTALSLTHTSNIPVGTYYVSVTEAGKTESTRLALIVGAYVAPISAVSATTNAVQANGVTATATFGASPYVEGATATVTITLSGTATATGTHTVGLTSTKAGTITSPAIVTKTVTAGAVQTDTFAFTFTMPANAVDDLVVTHNFVQAQSTAPTASITTVAKTAATQAVVNFTLGSAIMGTWKVYDASTGGNLVSGITASAVGTTLSLTHASNIPAGTYYVSVTEAGKAESTRLALTVGAYVATSNNVGGGSSGYSAPTPTPIKNDKVDVIFNKDAEKAATAKVEEKNNIKTTTVTLDAAAVKENLDKMDQANTKENDKKVIIPVDNKSDVVVGELDGQTVKNMEDKNAVLEIKTENASYTLPAADIKIDAVPSQMGKQIELKDIKVSVKIAEASNTTATIVADTAKKNSYTVVVKPVDFEISCTSGTKTVNVSKFNSYVERTVAIPNGIDPSKITTGVIVNSDGTFSHVPTTIIVVGGKYYAKINSLTNSTYTVISNPISFKDVEKHWSKEYVNDMGSRLIDSGVGNGNFAPDRAITRAEFASMIVKALGLRGTTFSDKFSDVKKGDPYYTAIYTAYEYGIISGYSNGKFGPQDLITRQHAMTMISKAMKIAEMDGSITDSEINSQLKLFKDSGNISSYAKQGAAICIKYGIFGGNKGKLNPISNITRAESATIIINLLKKAKLI